MQNEECRMQNGTRAFDKAAFDAAVSRPNGWDAVKDPVAVIRRMRGDVPLGNAAKMREALEAVNSAFDDALICTDYQMTEAEMDRLEDVRRKIKDALSTPPRNCDRCATKDEAIGAFLASRGATHRRIWSDECDEFIAWLFAPEGGRP